MNGGGALHAKDPEFKKKKNALLMGQRQENPVNLEEGCSFT